MIRVASLQRSVLSLVVILVLAAATLPGCVSRAGSTGPLEAPSPTIGAVATATTEPGDCIVITSDVEPYLLEADQLASVSSIVIEGDYLGPAGPAVWSTPGGRRPSLAETRTLRPSLSTPAKLANIQAVRGALAAPGRVLVPGGTSGCDSEIHRDQALERLVVGERYLFFLSPAFDTSKTQLPDVELKRAWAVARDGSVRSDTGTVVTPAQLAQILAANPYTPSGE